MGGANEDECGSLEASLILAARFFRDLAGGMVVAVLSTVEGECLRGEEDLSLFGVLGLEGRRGRSSSWVEEESF